jgi:hypothetical protein
MRKIFAILVVLASQLGSANAAAVITNLSYTANSITFAMRGNLGGYDLPSVNDQMLTILYTGNLYTGLSWQFNSYTGQLLVPSNTDTILGGNTGGFPSIPFNYTWVGASVDLNHETFSGTPVTISWNKPTLNPTGTGEIRFIWGHPTGQTSLIQSFSVTNGSIPAVPEPENFVMMVAGLALLCCFARKKAIHTKT